MSLLNQPCCVCPICFTTDVAQKMFLAASKNAFPHNFMICGMKQAIEIAARGKPPIIKLTSPDLFSMNGNLVSTVVNNWTELQLKKPPPKTPTKKPPVKKGKGPQSQMETQPQTPVVENHGPYIIFIADYPKTINQLREMINSCPVLCQITIDGGQPSAGKKGSAPPPVPSIDWQPILEAELPFITIDTQADTQFDTMIVDLVETVKKLYNSYFEFKDYFYDHRFLTIPRYPRVPISLPTLAPERPIPTKTPPKGSLQQALELPVVPTFDALQEAFKVTVMNMLDDFDKQTTHVFTTETFQHYAETLPKFPLPAFLAHILSEIPNFRDPFIYLMRNTSYRTSIPYETIYEVLMKQKFEDMIGYEVTERNVYEKIPLEYLSNQVAPLSVQYSNYKYIEFGGKILLAFFNRIPSQFPLYDQEDIYDLPVVCGFGKWVKGHPCDKTDLDERPEPGIEIGVNTTFIDDFYDINEDTTSSTVTRYFDESGLRIDTYPIVFENNLIEELSFIIANGQSERFSFHITQKNAPMEEEEEEIQVDTHTTIRGILGPECEFYFEHSLDKAKFSLMTRTARVDLEPIQKHAIITGAKNETHRLITMEGKLIVFGQYPTIYSTDGSIEIYKKGIWHLYDKDGNVYIKKKGEWFVDPDEKITYECVSTHFTSRKVINYSNGLTFIEDDDDTIVRFPNGTRYSRANKTFYHDNLPDICIKDDKIIVETSECTATLTDEMDCTLDMKNNNCSISYKEEYRHMLINFGQFKNAMTMIDLMTGSIVNVGTRRFVYYLTEEWKWAIGRQLCSKKEIIQHFQDGDIFDRIQHVDEVEKDDIVQIIKNGHKPRLFIIEKEHGDMQMYELLDQTTYKAFNDQALKHKTVEEGNATLWFDTKPKSYRNFVIHPKIPDDLRNKVNESIENEKCSQELRVQTLQNVIDPKWKELERQQNEKENELLELYQKFSIDAESNDSPVMHLSAHNSVTFIEKCNSISSFRLSENSDSHEPEECL